MLKWTRRLKGVNLGMEVLPRPSIMFDLVDSGVFIWVEVAESCVIRGT
jgi:hypothetical protein